MMFLSTQLVTSLSSTSNPRCTYDVFPSFHGKDVRYGFRSHLIAALSRKGFTVFIDNKSLERGEDLDEEFSKAIQESQSAVVVFSENYAFSRWCLRELAMIAECRRAKKLTVVLPVFYHVEPSLMRNQLGTFADAFAKHIKDPKVDKKEIETWRAALREMSKLAGWHVRDDRSEAKVVEKINQLLSLKLSHNSSTISEGLVGVKSKVEEVITLLCIGGDYDVRYVGICGMGGIGKTTIAEEVYKTISSQYETSCFLVCDSQEVGDAHLVYLQKQLLSKLLSYNKIDVWNRHEGTNLIANRLAHKKAFIVLDNVDQEIQIKALVGTRKWFGPGSKILIASRDCHLLAQYVDNVYQVEELCDNEALQLFSWKAFKKLFPNKFFVEISKDITDCAKRLPLAIEVFASSLYGETSIDFWKSARDQFKENVDSNILQKLILSFNRLEDIQKQLFLDIACFFKYQPLNSILAILESFGYNPNYNIKVLEQKSLLKTSMPRGLNMHDMLVQVGRQIVDQESLREPGKRSRLWRYEDIIHVLKNNDDIVAIEAFCLKLKENAWYEVPEQVSLEAFTNMKRLRMIEIFPTRFGPIGNFDTIKWFGDPSKFMLTNKLCYINWFKYPLKSLPTIFQPNDLVELILHHSHIKKLWDGRKRLQKLQCIDLSYSENLIETPDFTEMPNLKELVLRSCKQLKEVHQSVGSLKRLKTLDLDCCENLQNLPDMGMMLSLERLSLKKTKIETLPSSVRSLSSLKSLDLFGCQKLKEIPQNWGGMESLEFLMLTATGLKELPPSMVSLKKLKRLFINDIFSKPATLLLPTSFLGLSSLTHLSLIYCNLSDETIPNDLWSLTLDYLVLSGNKLTKIPQLPKCRVLLLNDNNSLRMLPKLPLHLYYLELKNCPLLDTFYMDMWSSNEMLWTSDSSIEEIYFGSDGEPYKMLQLHPKSPSWFHGFPPSPSLARIAWGPTQGNEIPGWFKQRSNSSSIKVQICEDVNEKLKALALLIVYEVREADPSERKRKVSNLDKHENSNYRGFYRMNPTFPEIVCQLQFNGDHLPTREAYHHLPRRVVFVLRAPYVTSNGLHGIWVVIPIPDNLGLTTSHNLGATTSRVRGSSVEASIEISSRNVDVKEFGVGLVQEHDVTECSEVLRGISPNGFASTILEESFSNLPKLQVIGPLKAACHREFRKRRRARRTSNSTQPLLRLGPIARTALFRHRLKRKHHQNLDRSTLRQWD